MHGFKSRLPILISGKRARRKGNAVEIDGHDVVLTHAPLRLFLRLVLALFESGHGWLSREALVYGWTRRRPDADSEGAVAPEGLDQAVFRLRTLFGPALRDVEPKEFIAMSGGRVRLSTHSRYVAFERDLLLQHEDHIIREIAARLPAAG